MLSSAPRLAGTGLLLALCLITYWPALDNDFMADDYVFLERVDRLVANPGFLFSIPPENFRTFTYLQFLFLKSCFGYWATPFYLFAIFLHFANCLLVQRLVATVTGKPFTGLVSAACFACFQNPQEAVMWLGGSHELPALFFILLVLNTWVAKRRRWSLVFFVAAMFAKETAPIVLALLPLVDYWASRAICWRAYVPMAGAGLVFGLAFVLQLPQNSLARHGLYAVGPHLLEVLGRSLLSLAFPWAMLAAGWRLRRGLPPQRRTWLAPGLFTVVGLLPYLLLTYQNHVPSRHEYLASVGVAALVATLVTDQRNRRGALWFMALFVTANVGYIHLRKDAQFEARAAPTRQLIQILQETPPQPLTVQGFPYNPWVAKLVTRRVPRWTPDLILAPELDPPCPSCPAIEWDSESQRYRWLRRRGRSGSGAHPEWGRLLARHETRWRAKFSQVKKR